MLPVEATSARIQGLSRLLLRVGCWGRIFGPALLWDRRLQNQRATNPPGKPQANNTISVVILRRIIRSPSVIDYFTVSSSEHPQRCRRGRRRALLDVRLSDLGRFAAARSPEAVRSSLTSLAGLSSRRATNFGCRITRSLVQFE